MEQFNRKIVFFFWVCTLIYSSVHSSISTNIEADIRYYVNEQKRDNYIFDNIRFSARKNIAYNNADRFTLFILVQETDMFSQINVKEGYIKYKGPMGKWNITFGRFSVPYGLKYYYSTDALPWSTVEDFTVGMDNDNGIMLSGVTRYLDYAISVTHGYNSGNLTGFPLNGLIVSRIGTQLGTGSEVTLGLSVIISYSSDSIYYTERKTKQLAGIDCIAYIARSIVRCELSGGFENEEKCMTGYLGIDYSVHSKVELNFSGSLNYKSAFQDKEYLGISYRGNFFTIRGGCQFEYYTDKKITGILQIHKLFSFSR